jgi:hypothetical protein
MSLRSSGACTILRCWNVAFLGDVGCVSASPSSSCDMCIEWSRMEVHCSFSFFFFPSPLSHHLDFHANSIKNTKVSYHFFLISNLVLIFLIIIYFILYFFNWMLFSISTFIIGLIVN